MLTYSVYAPLSRSLPPCLACLDYAFKRFAKPLRLFLFILVIPLPAWAADFHGPAPMKNHHPLYTGLLLPVPEQAAPTPERWWEIALDYSNIFLFGTDQRWAIAHDYELIELSLTLRQPLVDDRAEIGFRAPLFYQFAGFMDGLLRSWHRFVGVRGYAGQDDAPDYRYRQEVYFDDREMAQGREREVIAGDVTLWLKGRLWQEKESVVSGALYVQLPTGDATTGLGSGGYEYALRLMGSTVAEGVGITWGLGFTGPSRFEGIATGADYEAMASWYLATEWPLAWLLPVDDWTLIIQTMGNTSPVRETSLYQYSREFYDITIGARYAPDDGPLWTIALSENLNKTNPDFTLDVTVAW